MSRTAFVAGFNGPPWTTRLKFAEDDAQAMADCLATYCGFNAISAGGGDCFDIMRQITSITSTRKDGDDLLLYFSSHGEVYKGDLYLLCDSSSNMIYNSSISTKYILELMTNSAATHKLLILDCCYAGRAAGFKGGLRSILDKNGSQQVLCAGDAFDEAKEFEKFGASFLRHHLCNAIAEMPSLSLNQLMVSLRSESALHNTLNQSNPVPAPFLFGKEKSEFMLRGTISPIRGGQRVSQTGEVTASLRVSYTKTTSLRKAILSEIVKAGTIDPDVTALLAHLAGKSAGKSQSIEFRNIFKMVIKRHHPAMQVHRRYRELLRKLLDPQNAEMLIDSRQRYPSRPLTKRISKLE